MQENMLGLITYIQDPPKVAISKLLIEINNLYHRYRILSIAVSDTFKACKEFLRQPNTLYEVRY